MQHLLASSRIFEDTKEDREQDNVMIHKEITDDMYRIGIRKKTTFQPLPLQLTLADLGQKKRSVNSGAQFNEAFIIQDL